MSNILTKNGLCTLLKQYPNMPIFVQHDGHTSNKPRIIEGFFIPDNTSVTYTIKEMRACKKKFGEHFGKDFKPCLILY